MSYTNLPGVKANYIDGAFFNRPGSNQPRILILGVAEKGDSYKLFRVFNEGEATREFGSNGSMIQRMFEAYSQGADNVYMMRIGGTTSTLVLTDSTGGTLTIGTTQTGDDSAERFSLFLGNYENEQRVLIWDNDDSSWVYDSHELAVINDGSFSVLNDGWLDVFRVGCVGTETVDTFDTGAEAPFLRFTDYGLYGSSGTLGSGPTSSFTGIINSATFAQGGAHSFTPGADGVDSNGNCTLSYPELYIALERAYEILDFQYTDIIIPCDIFIDAENITEMDDGSDPGANNGAARVHNPDYSALPVKGSANDVLGYFWKYRRGGYVSYAMSKVQDPSAEYASTTISITDAGTGEATLTVASLTSVLATTVNPIAVTVAFNNTANTHSIIETASTVAITIGTLSTVTDAATLQTAIRSVVSAYVDLATATVVNASTHLTVPIAATAGSIESGPYMLTHEQLTNETISASGLAKLGDATALEFREINFAHQLASFCHSASTNWKTLIGLISFKPVIANAWFDPRSVNTWLGEAPDYITIGGRLALDNIDDNGNGVLGNKLIAGVIGYRWRELEGGTQSDGLAHGGLVLTKGGSLPNAGEAYGIDQSDEAKDSNGFSVDLGKYVMVTGAWPRITNSYSSQSYRAPITGLIAGRLAVIPEYSSPIGPVNGAVNGVSHWNMLGMSSTIANQLLDARITTLASRTPNQAVRYYFAGMKTAAHPDSDYSKITTIRCVNRILQGIRNIGEKYIGNSFTSTNLISLQTALNGYLKAEEQAGYHQGAAFQLSYSRADRIMGKLNIQLKMIPPFSIEAITVNVTLAADQAGLA